jgi:glucokinase
VEAVRRAGHHLGIGIALAVNLLNPESILLGGGVLEGAGDLILKPAREAARRHSQTAVFDCCSIRPAALGNRAGFIGAALYARDHPGA